MKCSNLHYIESTKVNEVKLVLQMVNYFRNSAWKSGRKVQYHGDSNAFCAVGSFYCRTLYLNILPHLGRVAGVTLCPLTVVLVVWRYGAAESVEMQSCGGGSGLATAAAVRSRLFSKAKVKSLCMTAVIVAAFIICWTPYQVANTYRGTQLGSHVCACDCCPVSERQLSSPEFALRGAELLWRYLILYRKMFVDASKCLTFQTRTMPLTNLNASSWKKNVPMNVLCEICWRFLPKRNRANCCDYFHLVQSSLVYLFHIWL